MPARIALPSTCRICGEAFTTPSLLIVGQTDEERLGEFGGRLAQHILTSHKDVALYAATMHQQFDGMICLMNFNIAEDKLVEQLDMIRFQIHRLTRRAVVTDDTLMQKTAELGLLNPDDEQRVFDLMKTMRDVLEERGRYPHLTPSPAPGAAI